MDEESYLPFEEESEQNCKTTEARKCWAGKRVESGGTYLANKQEKTGRMRGRGEEWPSKARQGEITQKPI